MRMMKNRFALISTALAALVTALGVLSPVAEAQSVSGSIYYGPSAPAPIYVQPQAVYVEPQPIYVEPPAYYVAAPTYYYPPPAPTYYVPPPPPVYYQQPSYWAPGISASFDFGGGSRGGGHHWGHH